MRRSGGANHAVNTEAVVPDAWRENVAQAGAADEMSLAKRRYFDNEARIARDPSDPRHLNPAFPPDSRVVCVGCGGGWEGEATNAARFVGVDIDVDARSYRLSRNCPVEFHLASAEKLPFASGEFTFYVARVSVMYMNLDKALAEAYRVLGEEGTLWVTYHDFRHAVSHFLRSIRSFRPKGIVFRAYVILNGLLYHFLGRQFSFNHARIESFQTRGGLKRGLERAGFADVSFPATPNGHFLVTARKPATRSSAMVDARAP